MNFKNVFNGKFALAIGAAATSLLLVSFQEQPREKKAPQSNYSDTVPPKKKKVNLDAAMGDDINWAAIEKEVAKAMKEVDEAMKGINFEGIQKEMAAALKEFDGAKLQKEIATAMKEVDFAKIQEEIKAAMKEVDSEKMQKELAAAMKEVDFSKIQEEVRMAMKEVDAEKIQAEIKAAMKGVDLTSLAKEMEKVKSELATIKPQVEEAMKKAKEEIKDYKNFIDGLEKDGLLNKKEYSIQYKSGILTINGKEAPASTLKKYKSYLDKHQQFNYSSKDQQIILNED